MTYKSVAKSVRESKEQHPERYCTKCLFNISRGTVCPRHQAGKSYAQVFDEYRQAAQGQITYYTNLGAKNGQDYSHYIAEAQDRLDRMAKQSVVDPVIEEIFKSLEN